MNKDTHTPVYIDGKIYVVVNAPDKPDVPKEYLNMAECDFERVDAYAQQLTACTKYPTLEDDREYWKEKIGQRVEVELRVGLSVTGGLTAIPPQQKQDNEDLWDEAENGVKQLQPDQPYGAYSYPVIIDYLKQHFQLIKRK